VYGTAAAPTPDPISSRSLTTPPRRSAANPPKVDDSADDFHSRENRTSENGDEFRKNPKPASGTGTRGASLSIPTPERLDEPARTVEAPADTTTAEVRHTGYAPSAVRVTQWVARKRPTTSPAANADSISVAKASSK
jgi:hypothetical protein